MQNIWNSTIEKFRIGRGRKDLDAQEYHREEACCVRFYCWMGENTPALSLEEGVILMSRWQIKASSLGANG